MSNVTGARPLLYCNQCGDWHPETDFSEFARDQARQGDEEARCQECVNKLFKNRLQKGSGEIAAYIKEDRDRRLQRTRNPLLEQMVGDGRWGQVMHSNELIRKLTKILPELVPGPGAIEDNISLYRVRPGGEPDFICWTGCGYLPEFSIVHFNKDRQPIREQRGWRTVLLRVIKAGLITEAEAEKEFGRPSSPQQDKFWREQLWNFRHDRTEGQNFEGLKGLR
jgi:hypothetical protein